ncbi:uncharacterized protein PODANS_5_3240 [Podospora anserina S mat+]|uniref:Podospora anserina S mat+ genomic DNA chromosome 5, supercontig 4 n=1 Tax=Podospora anserina (strain S / ATCC MYA-4624 / DSM 980 / FGSC 10383) TaxID=515849 RepID=B2ALF6_PODAN|nr:uncharacterized protein PODANS_5_3240 [Podospora anserina S mat+]CAP64768.1 unnamed protein product [Podospora anserina S mat+]CDP29277.1 Putative protein of unknown function [Podospora anserina S mat+]
MPAILEDPAAPTIYRISGDPPYPDPAKPTVPASIVPRHVTLRDRQTEATVIPFASRDEVPESLLRYLSDQFSKEIEGGDTYPMMEPMSFDKFAAYWFQNFAGIMLLGNIESAADVIEGKDWSKECLGTFYIKPNYPGRSSHICNAGFIVTDASRNRGVGRLMGETYLEWAPQLGYKYSVFNLVYETNVASCKIWDALGFKRIGRVKGAGNLKSHPDRLVDAIIYGRDLGDAAGGAGNEELKSRLRSAATHYKLLEGDVLMLKDKEVISDPQRQYEIARTVHNQAHAGINKTTATIAERYHWSRIKETVSDVIRNCTECKELGKPSSSSSAAAAAAAAAASQSSQTTAAQPSPALAAVNGIKRPSSVTLPGAPNPKRSSPSPTATAVVVAAPSSSSTTTLQQQPRPPIPDPPHLGPFTVPRQQQQPHPPPQYTDPTTISLLSSASHSHGIDTGSGPSVDAAMGGAGHHDAHHQHHHPHHHVQVTDVYQPIDPQIIQSSLHHHHHHHHHHHQQQQQHHDDGLVHPGYLLGDVHHPHHHHQEHDETDAFQALINAGAEEEEVEEEEVVGRRTREEVEEAVDRDLEMLIEEPVEEEDEGKGRGGKEEGSLSPKGEVPATPVPTEVGDEGGRVG